MWMRFNQPHLEPHCLTLLWMERKNFWLLLKSQQDWSNLEDYSFWIVQKS